MAKDLTTVDIASNIDLKSPIIIYDLHVNHGKTFKEIATAAGKSKQAIQQKYQRFIKQFGEPGDIKKYIEIKGQLLNGAEMILLSSLVDKRAINEADLNKRGYTYGVVAKQNLLEQGKPTEHIQAVDVIIEGRELLDKIRQAKEGK